MQIKVDLVETEKFLLNGMSRKYFADRLARLEGGENCLTDNAEWSDFFNKLGVAIERGLATVREVQSDSAAFLSRPATIAEGALREP